MEKGNTFKKGDRVEYTGTTSHLIGKRGEVIYVGKNIVHVAFDGSGMQYPRTMHYQKLKLIDDAACPTSKNPFKTGDRVELSSRVREILRGERGVVIGANDDCVDVAFDNPCFPNLVLHHSHLKLIELEPTGRPADLTLRQLQLNLPWSIRYSRDFRASPIAHKDFAHALTHVGKAAGFLHALVDDMDHDRDVADNSAAVRERAEKYIADLVICAMRMANTLPGGVLDLQRAVQHRIESKNGVKLPTGD